MELSIRWLVNVLTSILPVWILALSSPALTQPPAFAIQSEDEFASKYLVVIDSLSREIDSLLKQGQKSVAANKYMVLSDHAQEFSQPAEMLDYNDRALELYRETNDVRGEAYANFKKGYIFRNYLHDNESALVYHNRFLQLSILASDSVNIARGYQNVANILRDKGNLVKAEQFYGEALQTIEKLYANLKNIPDSVTRIDIQNRLADVRHDFGELKVKTKEYSEAIAYFEKAKAVSLTFSGQAMARLEEAKIHAHLKNYLKAIALTKEAMELGSKSVTGHWKMDCNKMLSELYEATNDYKNAFYHLSQYQEFRERLKLIESGKAVAIFKSQRELDNREKELELLALEKETVEFRRNAYGISIILVSIIAVLVYTQQRVRNKRNTALLEKEKEVDHLKAEFFTNISHELRTPLTLILGPLHEARRKSTDESINNDLRVIDRNTNHLLMLVNRLLDLQKIEAGQMPLRVSKINLNRFLKIVVSSFESLAQQRKINFQLSLPDTDIELFADQSMLEEMIMNLLSNAFKFTPENGTIEVSAVVRSEYIEIDVKDTGKGIPVENINSVFKRFYQGGRRTEEYQAGTGLGLTLVKELIELHSGKISVESSPGKGARFTLAFPAGSMHFKPTQLVEESITIAAEVKVQQDETHAMPVSEGSAKDISILIVDDNEDLRNFIGSILPDTYAKHYAENGERAIALAKDIVPDMVISDVMMPVMDGLTLCERLKTNEVTSHIPVILLTARADKESKVKGLETAADDYLTKPFDRDELNLRVRNQIESHRKLRARFNSHVDLRPSEISVNSADQRFLQKVRDVVEANLANELFEMEDMEREIGMSRSQIHRKLKALTDKSASQIIRSMRLLRAKDLLAQHAGGVAEIGYKVGFSSSTSFIRAYKEQFGHSPGEELKAS